MRRYSHQIKQVKAMTLLEVIVVLMVLAALASVALFTYRTITNKAHDRSASAALQQISKKLNTGSMGQPAVTDEEIVSMTADFTDGRFNTAPELSTTSSGWFGQIAYTTSPSKTKVGLAVLSNSGACVTGIYNKGRELVDVTISNTTPCVPPEVTDEQIAGLGTDPPAEDPPAEVPPAEDPPIQVAGMVMPQYEIGDFGVFSERSLNITNSFKVIPVNETVAVWAGNNFSCNSSGRIEGNLLVNGDVTLTNNCAVTGLLWTGGSTSSTTTTVALNNVITNGYTTSNPVTITGLLSSPTKSGPWTAGSNSTEHQRPPVVKLPKIDYLTDNTWAGTTWNRTTWADVITNTANTNGAPAWSGARTNPCNDLSAANYSLKGHITLPATPTVIDGRSCGKNNPITFNGNPAPLQLRIAADTIIYAGSFVFDGNVTVTSADGNPHRLWIITPAQYTDTCDPAEAKIEFKAGGQTWDDKITVSTYTGGTTTFTNNLSFTGSTYSCTINASVNTTIKQKTGPLPQNQ